jgi:hypothetical protein
MLFKSDFSMNVKAFNEKLIVTSIDVLTLRWEK